jgi:hypothetical protein
VSRAKGGEKQGWNEKEGRNEKEGWNEKGGRNRYVLFHRYPGDLSCELHSVSSGSSSSGSSSSSSTELKQVEQTGHVSVFDAYKTQDRLFLSELGLWGAGFSSMRAAATTYNIRPHPHT